MRTILDSLDFREQPRMRGGVGVNTDGLAERLEQKYPLLLGAVAIPNQPKPPQA